MHAYRVFILFLLMILLLPLNANPRTLGEEASESMVLLPLGPVERGVLDFLKSELPVQFHSPVRVADPVPLMPDAFDAKRKQYNSTKLLEHLFDSRRNLSERWLGVTEADLYVPTMNFVFGQADTEHHIAVISLARLGEEFYRHKPNLQRLQLRALKEAIHELGHTYGLNHCSNSHCVMFFSNSLQDTDAKSANFCEEHRKELRR